MKPSQNVLKMFTVSRKTGTPLMAATTIERSSFLHSLNLWLCFFCGQCRNDSMDQYHTIVMATRNCGIRHTLFSTTAGFD